MDITKESWQLFLQGFMAAMGLSAGAGILGITLGFGLYMLQQTEKRICSLVVSGFVYLIRKTPIPMLFFLLYYIVVEDERCLFRVIIVGLSIYFSVKILILLQDNTAAIGKGQKEAAVALGYTKQKAFFRIILPQVIEYMLPALKKEYNSLLKLTSIAGFLIVVDLAKLIENIRIHASEVLYPLGAVAVIYYLELWIISFIFSLKKQYKSFRS